MNWFDAVSFCEWLSHESGRRVSLPSEAEWEKAARGTDGRLYPWGDDKPSPDLLDFSGHPRGTSPIGHYSPQSDSPYGCADMMGNVREWTRSLWGFDLTPPLYKYPYLMSDGREDLHAAGRMLRVIRSNWRSFSSGDMRVAQRYGRLPSYRDFRCGFRVLTTTIG